MDLGAAFLLLAAYWVGRAPSNCTLVRPSACLDLASIGAALDRTNASAVSASASQSVATRGGSLRSLGLDVGGVELTSRGFRVMPVLVQLLIDAAFLGYLGSDGQTIPAFLQRGLLTGSSPRVSPAVAAGPVPLLGGHGTVGPFQHSSSTVS